MYISDQAKVILTLGAVALVASQAIPGMIFDEVILGYVGTIYLLTAASYEVREFVSVRYAVGVSVVGVSLPTLHRLVLVSAVRPEVAPVELTFVFFQEFVLIPLVVAFFPPLSRVTSRTQRLGILAAILIPFVIGVVRIGTQGFGFFFNVSMFSLMFATGAVLGLPLYFYGKATDPESTGSVLEAIY